MTNKLAGLCFYLLTVTSGVWTQNDDASSNATAPAAPVAPAAPAAPAARRDICRSCVCSEDAYKTIDCHEQGIDTFFHEEEWLDIAPTYNSTLVIDLSHNELAFIPTLPPSFSLNILNLSRNDISVIQNAAFKELRNLTHLDLSWNNLSAANFSPHVFEGRYSAEQFEPLGRVRYLSLAHNSLHSLPQDVFEHLGLLKELDLSGNPLAVLDYSTIVAISSLPVLEYLRLRSCRIKYIPDKFLHTPRALRHLDISDNRLTAVPQELEETHQLRELNLNQNPIVEINDDSEDYPGFPLLEHLERLHVCNMPNLTRITSSSMSRLPALRALHLSYNPRLTHIAPKALARPDDQGEGLVWPPIQELYLQYNNVSELDRRLVARWGSLTALEAAGNPWRCACDTQWMVDELVTHVERTRENASSELVCQEPIEMRGLTLQHLHNTHRTMRCLDKYGNRPERDGAILLGTLIGVLLAVPVMLSLVLLWRRGALACLGLPPPAAATTRAYYQRAPLQDNYI